MQSHAIWALGSYFGQSVAEVQHDKTFQMTAVDSELPLHSLHCVQGLIPLLAGWHWAAFHLDTSMSRSRSMKKRGQQIRAHTGRPLHDQCEKETSISCTGESDFLTSFLTNVCFSCACCLVHLACTASLFQYGFIRLPLTSRGFRHFISRDC